MTNNVLKPAKRLDKIAPFYVMDILAKAKILESQGVDIIHMEVGEPDFETSECIMSAASRAIADKVSHYTPALGLPELKQSIAHYYKTQLDCHVDPKSIAITPGASGAIQLVLSSILDEGDEVLLTDPGYPCNRHLIRLLSATDINVPLNKENDFLLTPAVLDEYITDKTKALMIASPNNPTGSCYSVKQIKALASWCSEHNLHFIVDEIYQGLQYEKADFSAIKYAKNCWVINSFSKYFGMTGFRIGWMIVPENMMLSVDKLAQNLYLAPASIAQYAAIAAMSDDALKEHKRRKEIFKERRDYLYNALFKMGFTILNKPDGAFYIYANCEKFGIDSLPLAEKLLTQANVAITPGKDFATIDAEKYVRFAYTTNLDNLEKAVQRMTTCLLPEYDND